MKPAAGHTVRNQMLRPISESPSAKVLNATVQPAIVFVVRVASGALGCLGLYVLFAVVPNFMVQPDFLGALFLGMFISITAAGFALWIPSKYLRGYFAINIIFVSILELVANIAIVMR